MYQMFYILWTNVSSYFYKSIVTAGLNLSVSWQTDSSILIVTTQRRTLICTGLLWKQGNQHHITGYGNESQQSLQSETVNWNK